MNAQKDCRYLCIEERAGESNAWVFETPDAATSFAEPFSATKGELPKMTSDSLRRDRYLQIRLTDAEVDEIHAYCEKRGLKVSAFARGEILRKVRSGDTTDVIRLTVSPARSEPSAP